jgi:hypothetical protein
MLDSWLALAWKCVFKREQSIGLNSAGSGSKHLATGLGLLADQVFRDDQSVYDHRAIRKGD